MLNKEKIISNFSGSAESYDRHAILQKEMADEIFAWADTENPSSILDIGCGTGYLTARLAKRFPSAEVVGIDIAPGMIEVARRKSAQKNLLFAVGDGEGLPFSGHSFDLVVANASLQWMRLSEVLPEVLRVLRPKGKFLFNTFGPETLRELKQSRFRVNSFVPSEKIEGELAKYFKKVKVKSWLIVQEFGNVRELISHLREIGAKSSTPARGDSTFSSIKKYNEQFRVRDAVYATFEIVSGQGQA